MSEAPVPASPYHEYWEALLVSAVVGTERRPAALPGADDSLSAVCARLDRSDSEGALLGAAAAVGLYQRAGALPPSPALATPAPAPESDLPVCTPQAAQHLQAILSGRQRALLPEWLAALAAAGQRIPSAVLPELLELGRGQAGLRAQIRAAVGARGQWLAAQNPDWDFASAALHAGAQAPDPATLTTIWETGSRAARLSLLEILRNHQPDQARALIEDVWSAERADDRDALLGTLRTNLSMADEPFLEATLDDRSKDVRATAVELLRQLPESRLVQRMVARVTPLLSWTPPEPARLLGLRQRRPGRLDVSLPGACDKSMARDGVDPKPGRTHQGMGERAQWLLQMLRCIPPRHWSAQWGASPAELIEATAQSEWQKVVEAAWISAAQHTADATWAEALLRHDPSLSALLPAIPPARQEALLLGLLGTLNGSLAEHPALALLRQTEHTWSAELTRAVLQVVRKQLSGRQHPRDYLVTSALDSFAYQIAPELLREATQGWPEAGALRERWGGAIDNMLVTLQLRHDMLQALRAPGDRA